MIKPAVCLMMIAAASVAGAADKGKTAGTTLKDAKGKNVGTATFTERQGNVEVRVKVSGLPPGKHGFHVHETGKCEAPGFSTAGSHFNPTGKRHGALNPQGSHAGDMPNLEVRRDGTGELTAVMEGVTLGPGANSLLKQGGTALMIHAGPDDMKSDPTGNSGDRIACGVIVAQ